MESNQRVARLNVRLALLCIRVCPPTILYTTLYAIPAITPPQLSRRRSHVIDEWQMHLNKSIAGIAHCKYHALVLLFYLASLQPPFKFVLAVRAASLSVTYGPTLLIYFNFYCRLPAPPLRHRRSRPTCFCRGKIALAHRHRRCGSGNTRLGI